MSDRTFEFLMIGGILLFLLLCVLFGAAVGIRIERDSAVELVTVCRCRCEAS